MAKFGSVGRKNLKASRQARAAARPSGEGLWDRPQLVNLVADLLLFLAGAMLIYAALLESTRLPFFPLREVVVANALVKVTPGEIADAAGRSLSGNFFTVNLDKVRAALENMAWVRSASVQRLWPDGIELKIEEQVAAARWQHGLGEPDLVNEQGELFSAPKEPDQAALPLLAGPQDSSAEVLSRYREFSTMLSPLHRTLRLVALSPRQSWQLRLDDGLTLELGRDHAKHPIEERVNRFVDTYAEVQRRIKTPISVIDMRYPNGFALQPGTPQYDKGNA